METELTTEEKIRRVPWWIAHGATNALFYSLTFGSSVFVLFLDRLGLRTAQIGLLLSLFPFCGVVALLAAPLAGRFGYKRTFILFYGLRKFVLLSLLLTPWVLGRFGPGGAWVFVVAVISVFALCRALAETAYYPWYQEFLPNSRRARLMAIEQTFCTLSVGGALLAASFVLGPNPGLGRFMILLAAGCAVGVLSVGLALGVPGGKPLQGDQASTGHLRGLARALKDRTFLTFLGGISMVALAGATLKLLPLFLREQVGLPAGAVVRVEVAASVAVILSSFLWGRLADRTGGHRLLVPVTAAMALLPVLWLVLPRRHPASMPLAAAASFLWTTASAGVGICQMRLLFNTVVPVRWKSAYMAVYYAWIGLVGGAGPLLAGKAVTACRHLAGTWGPVHVDPYAPLFAACLCLMVAATSLYGHVRPDAGEPPAPPPQAARQERA